jgi:hypothetical protein
MKPIGEQVARSVKWTVELFGVDVVRQRNSPRRTWLVLGERPFRKIIDIGANRGQFAMEARRRFPAATIHALEPLAGPSPFVNSTRGPDSRVERSLLIRLLRAIRIAPCQ